MTDSIKYLNLDKTERQSRVLSTLLPIREVQGSNLGPEIGYPD
jgi:hypothetical protein